MTLEEKREYYRKDYHKRKHTPKYIAARKKRYERFWTRHPCKRMAKFIKKKDLGSSVTPFDIWKIAKRQKMLCPLTGRKLDSYNISPDHILPFSAGGKSDSSNIRLVVKEVNIARNTLSDTEFIRLCNDVTNHCRLRSPTLSAFRSASST